MENAGEELNELHEQVEHAEHAKMIEVSFTMSVLAVLLAAATLLGHRAHTEETVLSNDRTDQWNFYQFKKVRGSWPSRSWTTSRFSSRRKDEKCARASTRSKRSIRSA